jgi:predicted ABC-type ATPase
MIAGPNGSGKTTLLRGLRANFSLPLGYCLNPDEVERELQAGRIYLGWQSQIDEAALHEFVRSHPLGAKITGPLPSVRDNGLVAPPGYRAGYFTAILCDFLRNQWLATGESFTFETVMSHPDKVDFLRKALDGGYRTYLYFVCTESALINRSRVKNRFASGGHDVAGDKIDERYARSLSLLPGAVQNSSRAYLFDNSEKSSRLIAEFEEGRMIQRAVVAPKWFADSGLDK